MLDGTPPNDQQKYSSANAIVGSAPISFTFAGN